MNILPINCKLTAVCAAALLAACGGGGSSTSSSAQAAPPAAAPISPAPSSPAQPPAQPPVQPPSSPAPTAVTIGGTIVGNPGTVTLSLNTVRAVFTGASFRFPTPVQLGDPYTVVFNAASSGGVCTVSGGSGTAAADVTTVQVNCLNTSTRISTIYAPDAEVVGNLNTGDYNGDGKPDLVFTLRTLDNFAGGANNYLLRFQYGRGDGSFSPPVDVSTVCRRVGIYGTRAMATADLNLDGVDDVVCVGADTGLQVFRGRSAGSPVLAHETLDRSVGNLAIADINVDGYPDILDRVNSAGSLLHPYAVYMNLAGASFSSALYFGGRTVDTYQTTTTSFEAADFNGDGLPDLLTTVGECTQPCIGLGLFTGRTDGNFNVPNQFDTLPPGVLAGAAPIGAYLATSHGDLDGNGSRDAVITSTTTFVQVMLNDSSGRFAPGERVEVGVNPVRVVVADFDGDGQNDLATADAGSRTVTLAFGLGGGHFGTAAMPSRWKQFRLDRRTDLMEMSVADFNSNGLPDLVVAENGTVASASTSSSTRPIGRGSVVVLLDPGR